MQTRMKKVLAGAATLAAAATALPLLATPAFAATNNGGLTLSPTSGTAATQFSLAFPGASIACPGDSASGGYRVQSFVVPQGTVLDNLTFTSTGPNVGQPLFSSPSGNALVNGLTNITTGVVGQLPGNFSFSFDSAGDFSTGAYQAGIACTQGTGAGMTKSYWAIPMTLTTNAGGNLTNWSFGAAPTAPAITTVTASSGQLVVAFNPVTATPAVTTYTLTATPPSGPVVTQTGTTSPITLTGLTNGTAYALSLTATSSAGTSAAGTGTGTPGQTFAAPVVSVASGTGQAVLNWAPPVGDSGRTGYNLVITPTAPAGAALPTVTLPATATTYTATGLAPGAYSYSLTALYGPGINGTPAVGSFSSLTSQVLIQDITVTRPVGALVLTQVCGAFGALPADPTSTGFPTGLPAAVAVNGSTVAAPTAGGTAPTLGAGGTGGADPVRSQYPYPTNPDGTANPTYPTHCGIDLGNAQFVRSGAGAGQFFAASGRLNQVTVVDTRDGDLGWNVVGQVSNFSAGGGKSFSGSELGWTPVNTEDTGPFTDSLGNTYDQLTAAGGAIAPNTLVASGLSSNRTLISAPAFHATGAATSTGGLGTAIADARLKLLIPITAQSGTYTATLTISSL